MFHTDWWLDKLWYFEERSNSSVYLNTWCGRTLSESWNRLLFVSCIFLSSVSTLSFHFIDCFHLILRFAATSLIQEVIKYASSITNCKAVYLHVIAYNNPAIHFYKKMLFKLVRRLPKFYYINGQHYDSYLFVYYVNGGRSPCSPL